MTLKELLNFFENYYGERYSGVFLEAMTGYLSGKSPEFYEAAAEVMIKRFSRIYNKVPGIAEIEKHLEEIKGELSWKPTKALPESKESHYADSNINFLDELMKRIKNKKQPFEKEVLHAGE